LLIVLRFHIQEWLCHEWRGYDGGTRLGSKTWGTQV
jgi:hypothetical protein